MNSYTEHTFYIERGGTASLSDFNRFVYKVSQYLDQVTFGRAVSYDDTDQLLASACCDLIDAALQDEKGGEISQENIEGHQVTYTKGISNTLSYVEKQKSIINLYLGNTGLLYRGYYDDEV